MKICLLAQTFRYVQGGGHFWVYLNWAFGFHRAGAEIIWLETVSPAVSPTEFQAYCTLLRERLHTYGLPATLAFVREDGEALGEAFGLVPSLPALAAECDLLVNLHYQLPASIPLLFRRSALIDIDPGLLQNWVERGYFSLAPYDFHFSISDTIGTRGNPISTLGLRWFHTAPCVDTILWPKLPTQEEDPYTTVSHWEAEEYVVEADGSFYENTKKAAFTPYLGVAQLVSAPMELALCINPEETEELARLRRLGWLIRPSFEFSTTPAGYQNYIQRSRGEFSVSKPSYVKMQSGWISDRTLCYLACGRPVVVQNTGPLQYLPPSPGFLRFQSPEEVVLHFRALQQDYAAHAEAARYLAETVFDAKKVALKFLEIALA